jgi:hypothetical protein
VTSARVLTLVAVVALTGLSTWLVWPRPDTRIDIARGGVATVISWYGVRSPLSDTIVVGGSGARRTVRVINRDTMQHVLSLFTVKAGSQMDYTVPPGAFGGYCSAHPTGKTLTVVVR